MVPLCYRSATVNGLKNPACIRHASYCDIQDANEMRTVENAKWYISSISGVYRILPHPIYTMYISRDFNKNTATHDGWRWGLIEKKNKIALIVFNYSVTRVKL